MQPTTQQIFERFMKSPAIQKIAREIEDEQRQKREKLTARIAAIHAERAKAAKDAEPAHIAAKAAFEEARKALPEKNAELTRAFNKLQRARSLHATELAGLMSELEAMQE